MRDDLARRDRAVGDLETFGVAARRLAYRHPYEHREDEPGHPDREERTPPSERLRHPAPEEEAERDPDVDAHREYGQRRGAALRRKVVGEERVRGRDQRR